MKLKFFFAIVLIASLITGCKITVEPIGGGYASSYRGRSYGQQRGPQTPQIIGYREVTGQRWVSGRTTPGCDNGRRSQARPQSVMYYGGEQFMGNSQYCPPQRSPYMSYGQMGGFQQHGGYGGQFRQPPGGGGRGYRDSQGVYHP